MGRDGRRRYVQAPGNRTSLGTDQVGFRTMPLAGRSAEIHAMPIMERWKGWARALKREAAVLYLSVRDPRTPWYAKAAAACVVAYALSPIDLIPDPIPLLGYLDDLVLLPLGVWMVRRLIPAAVLADNRARAEADAAA